MSALVQNGKYGAINTADPTTMVYYVVRLRIEPSTLQDYKTVDKKFTNSDEMIVNT